MKREHVDLLELSTLRGALRSVVEEIPDERSWDKEVPERWLTNRGSESGSILGLSRKQIYSLL